MSFYFGGWGGIFKEGLFFRVVYCWDFEREIKKYFILIFFLESFYLNRN